MTVGRGEQRGPGLTEASVSRVPPTSAGATRAVPAAVDRAVAAHRSLWGRPEFVVRAPGRVNLIGEHTDYNDGFVLPIAIPFDTAVAVSTAPPHVATEVRSEGFGVVTIDDPADLVGERWSLHIRGVHKLVAEAGVVVRPMRATIASDVPAGASLSSSAALEVAVVHALLQLAGVHWTPLEVALLSQRVENEVLGLPSGIMDQLISASAVRGHASLIDCRSLGITQHRLPDGVAVVVMDTMTRRELVDSAFAARRAECEAAATALGFASLRDAGVDDLDRLPAALSVERRRAFHVITENQRTLDAVAALADGDLPAVGRLMNASHESLRVDYEVSGDALDEIVAVARHSPGCFGARMTGGGFAGCAVALVDADYSEEFSTAVRRGYLGATDVEARTWVCRPHDGAELMRPDD